MGTAGYVFLQIIGTLLAGVLQGFGFYKAGESSGEKQAQLAESNAVLQKTQHGGIAYAAAATGDPAAFNSLCAKFNF